MPFGNSLNHEREAKVWALRLSGATYAEIGQAMGFSRQRAKAICVRMLSQNKPSAEKIEEHRDTELLRLDRMLRAVWPDALKGNHGAIDRVLRISERRSRLLGLDATTDEAAATGALAGAAAATAARAVESLTTEEAVARYRDLVRKV